MTWINFLHFYQPANADDYKIKEALEYSYLRLLRALEEHPEIKFTINISGCLLLRLNLIQPDFISRLRKLVNCGQIELVGSAAYHALLPLVSEDEVRRQIKENEEILQKFFGFEFQPRGFFLPEMAYSSGVAKIIKDFGYEWLILDEISGAGRLRQIDNRQIYQDKNSGLKVIFRSREFSSCYVPDNLVDFFKKTDTVITATDAELYGLRHKDPTGELEKALRDKSWTTKSVSDCIDNSLGAEVIEIVASNWESTEKELRQGEPYALWSGRHNKLQRRLWKLANLASVLIEKYRMDDNYVWARWHLVRGLASCTFWWASSRDFSHNFGPHAWNPDEIERGVNELVRAVRSLHQSTPRRSKIMAEKLYIKIKRLIWKKHWGQV